MIRMAERDELLWHFVHMVAGHDMESADCRLLGLRSILFEDCTVALSGSHRKASRSGSMTENDVATILRWNSTRSAMIHKQPGRDPKAQGSSIEEGLRKEMWLLRLGSACMSLLHPGAPHI